MSQYIPRVIDTLLEEYLETFGAVYIRGPKWCGKTTTAEQKAKSIVRFQDPKTGESNRMMAEIDPSLLLKGDNPRLLDEWQVVPKIWDAVRLHVDDLKVEGLFILTGSTVPVDDDQRHSGTGRISRLTMRPMSLMESGESNGKVSLSSLFLGKAIEPGIPSSLTIPQLAYVMVRGGWPLQLGNQKEPQAHSTKFLVSLRKVMYQRLQRLKKNPERVHVFSKLARNVPLGYEYEYL
jgi:predicted AAA+ superfamily ATPase